MITKSFIYHLKDGAGNLIDYRTSGKTAKELIEGHEQRLSWFEKKGFTPVVAKVLKPKVEFDPNTTKPCPTCGKESMPRMGVSKSGKPYKGYFCSEKEHEVIWAS